MTDLTRPLEILDRLIAFPTVSHDSNLDLINWVQSLLQHAGFEVTRLGAPDPAKAGLFARIGPKGDGGFCLSAHTDVVPVEGQHWTRPPFALTKEGGRLYGRGTTDMKGFLACGLAMAERAATAPLTAPLSLSISYDEEIGCVGIRQMMPALKDLIGRPGLVVVGEPTSMLVATGHKGKTALKVTCHGQAGHSALAPQFVNAIHLASGFVHQICALQEQIAEGPRDTSYSIPYSTLHIGKIVGGRTLNIVSDSAQLDMEFRHLAETPAEHLLSKIKAVAQQVSAGFPAVPPITVETITAYPGLNTDPSDPAVARAIELAGTSGTTRVPFGTEAGFFANLGLNTVVIGPGDMASDGHKPDEGLSLADLSACDAMMERILSALSSGG